MISFEFDSRLQWGMHVTNVINKAKSVPLFLGLKSLTSKISKVTLSTNNVRAEL